MARDELYCCPACGSLQDLVLEDGYSSYYVCYNENCEWSGWIEREDRRPTYDEEVEAVTR